MTDPLSIRMLRYLEGRASAGEVAELNAILLEDREARAQFLGLSAQAQLLHELTAPEEARRARVRRLSWIVAGAAALFVVLACFFISDRGSETTVAEHGFPPSEGPADGAYSPFIWSESNSSFSEPLPLRLLSAVEASSSVREVPRGIAEWFKREPTWDDVFDSPFHYPAYVWVLEFSLPEYERVLVPEGFTRGIGFAAASTESWDALDSIEAIGLLPGPPMSRTILPQSDVL